MTPAELERLATIDAKVSNSGVLDISRGDLRFLVKFVRKLETTALQLSAQVKSQEEMERRYPLIFKDIGTRLKGYHEQIAELGKNNEVLRADVRKLERLCGQVARQLELFHPGTTEQALRLRSAWRGKREPDPSQEGPTAAPVGADGAPGEAVGPVSQGDGPGATVGDPGASGVWQ